MTARAPDSDSSSIPDDVVAADDGDGDGPSDATATDPEARPPSEVSRLPTRIDSAVAAAGAIVAVAATGVGSVNGLVIGIVGSILLAVGLARGRHLAIDVGSAALFVGVVVAGYASGAVEVTLVGTVGCVVAWDLGQCAIDLGDQLGREAETTRLELVHAVSSVAIGLVTVTVGYALYVFAADGQPTAALVLLLLAAAFVTIGLGTRRSRSSRRSRGGGPY